MHPDERTPCLLAKTENGEGAQRPFFICWCNFSTVLRRLNGRMSVQTSSM